MSHLEDLTLVSGRANMPLAEAVAHHLKVGLGNLHVSEFSNENIFVKLNESVRENDVFIMQSLSRPVNTSIMETAYHNGRGKARICGPHHRSGPVLRLRAH